MKLYLLLILGMVLAANKPPSEFHYFVHVRSVVVVYCPELANSGTGFVVSPRHILTAAHVTENCKQFQVKFRTSEIVWAYIVKKDDESDLALLIVDEMPDSARIVRFEEKIPKLGEEVYMIHCPSEFGWSLSKGYVSYPLLREVRTDNKYIRPSIQVDIPAYLGTSGSPLFNREGKVLGMGNVMLDASGIVFFIPAQKIVRWLK